MLLGGSPAGFPQITAMQVTILDDYDSVRVLNIPSGSVGDVILVSVRTGGSPNVHSLPSGYTLLGNTSTTARWSHFYRVADGSEDSTITINVTTDGVTTQNVRAVAIARRISSVLTGEASFIHRQADTGATPGAATAPWGSSKNLFITEYSSRYAAWLANAPPAGYGTLVFEVNTENHVTSTGIASAHRELEAASDTPGAWDLSFPVEPGTTQHAITTILRGSP